MKKLQAKNQWALCVVLLMENMDRGVTPTTYMKEFFHKFPSRLGELEKSESSSGGIRAAKLKVRRLPITKKNRFGHSCTFTNYKTLASKTYLNRLLDKLNKQGLK